MNTTPVIIVGRGHGGTRAAANLLIDSGVFLGKKLGVTKDLFPATWLLEANEIASERVKSEGELSDWKWNFSGLVDTEPTNEFQNYVRIYAHQVLSHDPPSGWKFPLSTYCYPWLVKMFPEAYFIQWIRDPRDMILRQNFPDHDLLRFGIPSEQIKDKFRSRLRSWTYLSAIVEATPEPKRFITVKLEDFVLDHQTQVDRLSNFLSIPLKPIYVKKEVVGRYKSYNDLPTHPEATRFMQKFGYI